MKRKNDQALRTFLMSIEVSLHGYIYTHARLFKAEKYVLAYKAVNNFIQYKYGTNREVDYSVSCLCEVDSKDIAILEKYIDCFNHES